MQSKLKPMVAGNWKMNGTLASLSQIEKLVAQLGELDMPSVESLLCVPTTVLRLAAALSETSSLRIGAQDCHSESSGAYTGDISAEMIMDCKASHVILGHSERRSAHAETDVLINAKVQSACRGGLVAIVCVGESRDERNAGQAVAVLRQQLRKSLPQGVNGKNTVIAYEPIWAIGTGATPLPSDIALAHAAMRAELIALFGSQGASIRLLYGGSVTPENADRLMAIENVDGALVGGASLKADDFIRIVKSYAKTPVQNGHYVTSTAFQ